jgi:hypothetical protein
MGLYIPLGHGGATCPQVRTARLEAVTVRGIKTLRVYFCTCAGADSDVEQIKNQGWWPLRGNFVSALPLRVLNIILLPTDSETQTSDDEDDDEDGAGSSDSDGEDEPADTDSSTSE